MLLLVRLKAKVLVFGVVASLVGGNDERVDEAENETIGVSM
jgi:hypothetical protein